MAGAERSAVASAADGHVRLGAALFDDLQVARRTRGRFGGPVILATHPSYPQARAYVLKLHRDARPAIGKVMGRLESVTTGEQFVFSNAEELLACLARDASNSRIRGPQ